MLSARSTSATTKDERVMYAQSLLRFDYAECESQKKIQYSIICPIRDVQNIMSRLL